MAAMKRNLEARIADLAKKSGYDFDFLMDCWWEVEDGDWNYFVGVTMEHDW